MQTGGISWRKYRGGSKIKIKERQQQKFWQPEFSGQGPAPRECPSGFLSVGMGKGANYLLHSFA